MRTTKHDHKWKSETVKSVIETAARNKGLTVEEFVRQAASAAGNCLSKAKRMARRFIEGGDAPDCVIQNLRFD